MILASLLMILCPVAPLTTWTGGTPGPPGPTGPTGAPVQDSEPFFREITSDEPLVAADQPLPLLVFFHGEDGDSSRMRTETFEDKRTRLWLRARFMPLSVDGAARPALVERYGIESLPTLLYLTREGELVERLEGFREPRDLIQESSLILRSRLDLIISQKKLAEDPSNPWLRSNYARTLLIANRVEACLEVFLQVWDENRFQPGFYEESFQGLPKEIARLALRHEPAKRALIERRDRALDLLLDEAGSPSEEELEHAALDLTWLNVALGHDENTFFAMRGLAERGALTPALREAMFCTPLRTHLSRERRYGDLIEACGDPLVWVQGVLEELKLLELKVQAEELEPESSKELLVARNQALAEATTIHQALLATDRNDDADDLFEMLLVFQPRALTCTSLMQSAKRARSPGVVQRIFERGLESLSGAELEELERTGRRLLPKPKEEREEGGR